MRLLITRPREQAILTASLLDQQGHTCLIDPLLHIHNTGSVFPDGSFDVIILTSINALPALDENWLQLDRETIPLLVTGDTTKEAAIKRGFKNCISVNGSALKLAEYAKTWAHQNAKILYPCAEKTAHDLPKILSEADLSCTPWPVYEAKASERFSTETVSSLNSGSIDAVLLYSPRTARIFTQLWQKSYLSAPIPHFFTLSDEISAELSQKLALRSKYPANPRQNDLFKLIPK